MNACADQEEFLLRNDAVLPTGWENSIIAQQKLLLISTSVHEFPPQWCLALIFKGVPPSIEVRSRPKHPTSAVSINDAPV